MLLNPDGEALRRVAPVASISARVWNVACHRRNDVATDLMHDAIMIMHFKKYDKLGVAWPTTTIFHPVDRLTGRPPGQLWEASKFKLIDSDIFVSLLDKQTAKVTKWSKPSWNYQMCLSEDIYVYISKKKFIYKKCSMTEYMYIVIWDKNNSHLLR